MPWDFTGCNGNFRANPGRYCSKPVQAQHPAHHSGHQYRLVGICRLADHNIWWPYVKLGLSRAIPKIFAPDQRFTPNDRKSARNPSQNAEKTCPKTAHPMFSHADDSRPAPIPCRPIPSRPQARISPPDGRTAGSDGAAKGLVWRGQARAGHPPSRPTRDGAPRPPP